MNTKTMSKMFAKMYRSPSYRLCLYVLGIFSMPFIAVSYMMKKGNDRYSQFQTAAKKQLEQEKRYETLLQDAKEQVRKKNEYFKRTADVDSSAAKIADKNYATALGLLTDQMATDDCADIVKPVSAVSIYEELLGNKLFLIYSFIASFPMYILMLIYSNPITKYIMERLFMMVFVIFGVIFLVFTILYMSPMDPAVNILGPGTPAEQVANFNHVYGLDQPYLVRLLDTFKNFMTFNLGNSFLGNESVATAIMNKFPVTMEIAFWSLVVSVAIAIPSGIISAIKQYSSFDYIFMFIALIGLSIPNFWLGLVMILNFSINLHWVSSSFVPGTWVSYVMPAIVLGTGLAASVARMTRSSMLEVKNADYILTAKAKGLSSKKVVLKHILGNAMIPIVTVVGLQFGGMLGGSAVAEKVFNINGLGSFIVDRQFIPDIPVVLAGVVYIAVVISLANLLVDILYAFLDPRIKSKMKNY